MPASDTDYRLPDYDISLQPTSDSAYERRDRSMQKSQAMEEAFARAEAELEDDSWFDDAVLEDVTDYLERGHIGLTASMCLFGAGYAAHGYLTGDLVDISQGLFVGVSGAKFLSDAYRARQKTSR